MTEVTRCFSTIGVSLLGLVLEKTNLPFRIFVPSTECFLVG